MRWKITAAGVAAVVIWTAAITVGITNHTEQATVLLAIYLVIGAAVATIAALALWLTDRIIAELRSNRAVGDSVLAELRSEHDEADRALRSILGGDDSSTRIRRIRT